MRLFHKHKKKLILEIPKVDGDLIEIYRWYICTGCSKKLHTVDAGCAFFKADAQIEDWEKHWVVHPRRIEFRKFLE